MLMRMDSGFIRIYPLAPGGLAPYMGTLLSDFFNYSTEQPSSKVATTLETIPCTMVTLRGQMSSLHSNGIDSSDTWSQK